MSDDLKERLRDRRVCSLAQNSCRNDWVCEQAADRIEELEANINIKADFIDATINQLAASDQRIEELEAENHLLKTSGIIEVAVRNPSVSEYMQHWEGRAEAAEAKLAKAVEALGRIKRGDFSIMTPPAYVTNPLPSAQEIARTTLAELKGQNDE